MSAEAGNATAGNVTEDGAGGADGDVVDAAEEEGSEEAAEQGKPGVQEAKAAPFYEGVGAGAQLGPDSQGGWGGKEVPPPIPGDRERELWLHHRANGYSDEFYGAAKRIRDEKSEKEMAQENADDSAIDGLQGAPLDPKISSLRERIGKFVGAFAGPARVVKPDYALRSLETQQEPELSVATPKEGTQEGEQNKAAAMPGAEQALASSKALVRGNKRPVNNNVVGSKLAGSSDSTLTDAQFLAKFKPSTVDEGEDYPCGWPGPPCADPGGEATSGGFLGGGGSKAFYGMQAMQATSNPHALRARPPQLTAVPSTSTYVSLSAELQAPLHFKGRSEKGNADEATPLLR